MQSCQRCCVCVSAVSPPAGMFTSHFVCLYAFSFIVFFFCSFLCFLIFIVVCCLCHTISGESFVVLIHRPNIFGCLFAFLYLFVAFVRLFVCWCVPQCLSCVSFWWNVQAALCSFALLQKESFLSGSLRHNQHSHRDTHNLIHSPHHNHNQFYDCDTMLLPC